MCGLVVSTCAVFYQFEKNAIIIGPHCYMYPGSFIFVILEIKSQVNDFLLKLPPSQSPQ